MRGLSTPAFNPREQRLDDEIIRLRAEIEGLTANRSEKGRGLYVVLPDQQLPFLDWELHEVVLRFLDDLRPEGIILSGDVTDLPQFSLRWPWNHRMVSDPVSSVRAHQRMTRQVLKDYRDAARPREAVIIPGNHDERFITYVTGKAPLLHAVEDASGEPLVSLETYFGAAALGYTVATDPSGMAGYPAAHHVLGGHLAVYHGWLLGNGKSGASALAHLSHLQHSVVVGHTHRQGKVAQSRHELDGSVSVLVGVEAGTLATVRGGLGHSVAPNWQQGFATVQLCEDGTFDADTASWSNDVLRWRGKRWQRGAQGVLYRG